MCDKDKPTKYGDVHESPKSIRENRWKYERFIQEVQNDKRGGRESLNRKWKKTFNPKKLGLL
ncbi:hypothetical protein GCM10011391_17810 [Pullulanibacillus camelliae]|uniref:Uncharacterized protein n=1 Tax=Pullulanibacillus camelliae TaxID=1707096 RepID=A0A8J2VS00_9BACL|nr:hypothetical protein GCM10011391_17810 [Pullulanibacillus camelliae]